MIRKVLLDITSQYLNAKKAALNGHPLYNYLKTGCSQQFYGTGIIDIYQYEVRGSAGITEWASVPWIAVFDKQISTVASKGYDIVYLFTGDMKGVYISLNQGWTYFKSNYGQKVGAIKIKQVVKYWQATLKSGLGAFTYDPINLKAKGFRTNLPKGYELGHICGKYYDANNLPSENELVRDLQNMISLFRELKGHFKGDFEKTNNYLFQTNIVDVEEDFDNLYNKIDKIIISNGNSTQLNLKSDLPMINSQSSNTSNQSIITSNSKQTDYELKNKKQQKLGLAGEYMVIKLLKSKGFTVEHVSKTRNDREGYDIKAIDIGGKELHIEVKTTTGGINAPFYLTDNELEHSRKYADIYYLYRIYNFDGEKGDFFIIEGDVSNYMVLETKIYITNGRKL